MTLDIHSGTPGHRLCLFPTTSDAVTLLESLRWNPVLTVSPGKAPGPAGRPLPPTLDASRVSGLSPVLLTDGL